MSLNGTCKDRNDDSSKMNRSDDDFRSVFIYSNQPTGLFQKKNLISRDVTTPSICVHGDYEDRFKDRSASLVLQKSMLEYDATNSLNHFSSELNLKKTETSFTENINHANSRQNSLSNINLSQNSLAAPQDCLNVRKISDVGNKNSYRKQMAKCLSDMDLNSKSNKSFFFSLIKKANIKTKKKNKDEDCSMLAESGKKNNKGEDCSMLANSYNKTSKDEDFNMLAESNSLGSFPVPNWKNSLSVFDSPKRTSCTEVSFLMRSLQNDSFKFYDKFFSCANILFYC